jgi:hypothetical protein
VILGYVAAGSILRCSAFSAARQRYQAAIERYGLHLTP